MPLDLRAADVVARGAIQAEEEGFEPPEALTSAVFKTAAFNHSATPPGCLGPVLHHDSNRLSLSAGRSRQITRDDLRCTRRRGRDVLLPAIGTECKS